MKEYIQKNKYILTLNNISYKLINNYDNNFIFFKLKELKNTTFIYYQNKYNHENILQLLKLNYKIYNNLQKVFELIEQAYLNKQILLIFDNKNNSFNLKLFIEKSNKEYILFLKKHNLDIKEKFKILIKQINSIKKDNKSKIKDEEFVKFGEILNNLESSINTKFQNNKQKLNLLMKAHEQNEKILNKNKNQINILKKEIKFIEDKYSKLGNNININMNNINVINNPDKQNENILKENEDKINKKIEKDYFIEKIYDQENKYKSSLQFRIILIGGYCVGKTWIIENFISYPSSAFSTIGLDSKTTLININNTIIKLHILDTPGLQKYSEIALMACKNQDLVIFVYSIDNLESFDDVKNKIKRTKKFIKKPTPFILVGSKSDLEDKRLISFNEGQELANREKMDFFIEVSAKNSFYIDELFFEAVKILYKKHNN